MSFCVSSKSVVLLKITSPKPSNNVSHAPSSLNRVTTVVYSVRKTDRQKVHVQKKKQQQQFVERKNCLWKNGSRLYVMTTKCNELIIRSKLYFS